jgi:hypothetical protein
MLSVVNYPFLLSVIILNLIMLCVVKLNVVMPGVIMLDVVMLNVVMLRVIMLSVIMLSVVMLSVIMLSVVMLNVIMVCRCAGYSSRLNVKSAKCLSVKCQPNVALDRHGVGRMSFGRMALGQKPWKSFFSRFSESHLKKYRSLSDVRTSLRITMTKISAISLHFQKLFSTQVLRRNDRMPKKKFGLGKVRLGKSWPG